MKHILAYSIWGGLTLLVHGDSLNAETVLFFLGGIAIWHLILCCIDYVRCYLQTLKDLKNM